MSMAGPPPASCAGRFRLARVLAVELLCSCCPSTSASRTVRVCGGAAVYRVVRQYANEIGPDVRDTLDHPAD